MSENAVAEKAYRFAVRIVRLCRMLRERRVERELTSQLLRSGTSVAANVSEAQYGYSQDEFAYRLRIALRECAEASTWLRILRDTDDLNEKEFTSIHDDCVELLKLLTAISVTLQKATNSAPAHPSRT